MSIPNPMDKDKPAIFSIADTQSSELEPFVKSMSKIKKSGVHNPLKVCNKLIEYKSNVE